MWIPVQPLSVSVFRSSEAQKIQKVIQKRFRSSQCLLPTVTVQFSLNRMTGQKSEMMIQDSKDEDDQQHLTFKEKSLYFLISH